MPTKTPEPSASKRLSEEALRPCSLSGDSVITAREVLDVASPIPKPEKIQPTPASQKGSVGRKARLPTANRPRVTDTQPAVISRSRRTGNQGRDWIQDPTVQPTAPTVSVAPARTGRRGAARRASAAGMPHPRRRLPAA